MHLDRDFCYNFLILSNHSSFKYKLTQNTVIIEKFDSTTKRVMGRNTKI